MAICFLASKIVICNRKVNDIFMKKFGFLILATALLGLLSCSGPELTEVQNGVQFQTDSCFVKVQFYKNNVVRVQKCALDGSMDKKSFMVVANDLENVPFKATSKKKIVTLETTELCVEVCTKTGAITYKQNGKEIVAEKGYADIKKYVNEKNKENSYSIGQTFTLAADEAIYGLGQNQSGILNYRGHSEKLVQTNTNAVIPFIWSTAGFGILWDNYSKTTFNDDANGCTLWSEVGDNLDYYVIVDQDADKVISGYRFLTGKAPMFGKWAYGYWQSKEHYHTQAEYVAIAKKYRDLGYPIDVLVQDWNWWGEMHDWGGMYFDKKRYPDPKKMIEDVKALNYHTMISCWPCVGPNAPMYKDFEKRGYLFNKKGWGDFKYYDPFNPEATKLYYEYLKNGVACYGWDGYWFDSTEPDITNALTKESTEYDLKTTGRCAAGSWDKYLNAFSLVEMTQLHDLLKADALKSEHPQRQYILTRSTYAGQQRAAAVTWSGDIGAAWDIYQDQIVAGLNHCVSGVPYWTLDVGAFVLSSYEGVFCNEVTDPAYQELYTRMFQFCTFCPIFRSHGSEAKREIWEFGEFTPTLVKFDHLRYRLLPYIYTNAWKIYNDDYTMMRPLAMDFRDKNVYNIQDEYMFGNSFLVAPVTEYQKYKAPQRSVEVPASAFTTKDGKPGIHATFYKDGDFKTPTLDTIMENPHIFWYCERPNYVTDTMFSIRFEGNITVPETGSYRFHIKNFDKKALYIDGKLLKMNEGGTEKYCDAITLTAGKHTFLFETVNTSSGAARTIICWKTPSMLADDATPIKAENVKTTREVYLPSNTTWFDFWTGKKYDGGKKITANAGLETMPLFVKAGSIIPMAKVKQYALESADDELEIRVYAGANGSFSLYEDENDGYDYEKGIYATIDFNWNDAEKTLTIADRKGSFPGMLQKRTFNIVLVSENVGKGLEMSKAQKSVVYTGVAQKIQF